MKFIDPVRLFYVLVEQGYNVAYLDLNEKRCDEAEIYLGMRGAKGQVYKAELSGHSSLHREITIAVNPDKFRYPDWKNISAVNIPIYLPDDHIFKINS